MSAPAGSGRLAAAAGLLRRAAGVVLPLFVLAELNYPRLTPQSQLAIFVALGLVLCFLPAGGTGERPAPPRRPAVGLGLALLSLAVGAYLVVHNEPVFAGWWPAGGSLGDRAGAETATDLLVGAIGLALVLEATRRSLGWALPLLSGLFLAYAAWGRWLPDWLLPHRGYGVERLVAQTFIHSQGVFGVALGVMFSYVFLFVVLGALLEASGATRFVLDGTRRLLGASPGGPAKVAVLSSGLMGSLSGSAVANTATTGTFTIPMMRQAGFRPHVAAGLEAAASSGGALVPPVMGAGAYMMLEIVEPPVTYLEILRAALVPACLYYLALYLIVDFRARRFADRAVPPEPAPASALRRWEGVVFGSALAGLVLFLLLGYSVFRAVTLALAAVLVTGALHRRTRLGWRRLLAVLEKASSDGVALVAAAASVGVVLGVVTLTGVGTRLPALILPLAQDHLLLALAAIMGSSILLGMGLPSAVCYLLLATLVGPVLGRLGVVPLAAHLFIFYFGLMSMVTPPVALAAYAASAIAGSDFLRTSFAAFRFAGIGFVLPFLFVLRPQLLLLAPDGGPAGLGEVMGALGPTLVGLVALAAAVAGHLRRPLGPGLRLLLLAAAALAMLPLAPGGWGWNLAGVALCAAALWLGWRPAAATTAAG